MSGRGRELPGGLRVRVASTPWARLRGLAGRRAVPPDEGLALPRCRSVHTIGMRVALDLIWLDGGGRPVRVDRGVPPWRLRSCAAARAVVEVAAGRADAFLAAGLGAPPPPPSPPPDPPPAPPWSAAARAPTLRRVA